MSCFTGRTWSGHHKFACLRKKTQCTDSVNSFFVVAYTFCIHTFVTASNCFNFRAQSMHNEKDFWNVGSVNAFKDNRSTDLLGPFLNDFTTSGSFVDLVTVLAAFSGAFSLFFCSCSSNSTLKPSSKPRYHWKHDFLRKKEWKLPYGDVVQSCSELNQWCHNFREVNTIYWNYKKKANKRNLILNYCYT